MNRRVAIFVLLPFTGLAEGLRCGPFPRGREAGKKGIRSSLALYCFGIQGKALLPGRTKRYRKSDFTAFRTDPFNFLIQKTLTGIITMPGPNYTI